MCTLTWWRDEKGSFEVFFNRDELKTRARAEAPCVHQLNGSRFLSPRDPEGGGTWMLANEYGVVLCLLNRWHEEGGSEQDWRSRGELVWRLAGVRSAMEVMALLGSQPLRTRKPFSLWAFDAHKTLGFDWSGCVLGAADPVMPVTSSSYRFEEVVASRRSHFMELQPARAEDLVRFHASEGQETSASSVRMCRPDAQTMSRSRVVVGPREVRWHYLDEQADLAGLAVGTMVTLLRH